MAERKVYIVDDDPGFRDSLATLLALNGFLTASFASGEDFLATVYHQLGIDSNEELSAFGGTRPIEIIKDGKVVKGIIS